MLLRVVNFRRIIIIADNNHSGLTFSVQKCIFKLQKVDSRNGDLKPVSSGRDEDLKLIPITE